MLALFCFSCNNNVTEDTKEKASIETKEAATAAVCFECTYPGGNKRIVFREYIRLWNNNGEVSGVGAGYSEGDPEWAFDFKGFLKDSLLEVKVNYHQEGVNPFSTTETWWLNVEKGSIRLNEPIPENLRSISNGKYHKVECDYIPENLLNLMNSHKGGK